MKRNNRLHRYITFAVVSLVLGGCKAPSLTQTEKVDLPEVFAGRSADTLTVASVSWKEFFPDVYLVNYIDSALANNHSFQQTLEQITVAREQLQGISGSSVR